MKNERLDLIPEDHKFNCGNCTAKARVISKKALISADSVKIKILKVCMELHKCGVRVGDCVEAVLSISNKSYRFNAPDRTECVIWVPNCELIEDELPQKPFDNLEENHAK